MIGPGVTLEQWARVSSKRLSRARDIASCGAVSSVASCLYSSRAFPNLGCVAQCLPLPHGLALFEFALLHRLLHTPHFLFFAGVVIQSVQAWRPGGSIDLCVHSCRRRTRFTYDFLHPLQRRATQIKKYHVFERYRITRERAKKTKQL